MNRLVFQSAAACGAAAAAHAADCIRAAVAARGAATIVVATGASQFALYDHLVRAPHVPWERVSAFHLDEYVGLPPDHPASFRCYLRDRFVERLPSRLAQWVELRGDAADPNAECARVGAMLRGMRLDLVLCGIGENGHLAFNDPPADFTTSEPFLVVELDEACRRQQIGEGWFPTLAEVPKRALTMSIPQMLEATTVVCTVPDARKAVAVRATLEGPVDPDCPASALQRHADAWLFLDAASAALLDENGANG